MPEHTAVQSIALPKSRKDAQAVSIGVSLISMPWRSPSNAAIGLASLKAAALNAGVPKCDVLYFNDRWFRYLFDRGSFSEELTYTRYSEFARVISELAGVIQCGEWMFSSIVFDEFRYSPAKYAEIFDKAAGGTEHASIARDLIANAHLAEEFVDECILQTDWKQYDIIGLSCVFYQLIPSLALAKRLRKTGYTGKIIMGGPLCEGIVGKQILEIFSYVDAVFDGESELSFPEYLLQASRNLGTNKVPGIWQRTDEGVVFKAEGNSAVREMDSLPIPVYTDFFKEIDLQGLVTRKDLAFPIEASRGCWWGQSHHCIFCGLNGSDMTYRSKSTDRIYEEIKSLHYVHGISHFAFTDNIVSSKFMHPLMRKLASDPLPITFFAEIKANLSRSQIKDYKRAGFVYLQPGIESLSSSVLKIMDKGISALANVACLKYCREVGITPFWNLLHSFPGEKREDYDQTLQFLKAIVHLQPPEAVTAMRLTRFSPSFDNSVALGFHDRRPAQFYKLIYPYPDEILSNLVNSFEFTFHDDLDRNSLLVPIVQFIADWKSQNKVGTLVIDSDCSGAIIYDSRFTRVHDFRVLVDIEALVYQFCDSPRIFTDIVQMVKNKFLDTTPKQVLAILNSFVSDYTMIVEDNRYLSLAMHDSEFIPWQGIAVADQISLFPDKRELA